MFTYLNTAKNKFLTLTIINNNYFEKLNDKKC